MRPWASSLGFVNQLGEVVDVSEQPEAAVMDRDAPAVYLDP